MTALMMSTVDAAHARCARLAVGLREAPEVEAGRLAAITLQPLSKLRTLWMIVRGVMGRLDGAQGVDSFAFDRLVVQPRRRAASAKVAIDGEIFRLPTPLIFRIELIDVLPGPGRISRADGRRR